MGEKKSSCPECLGCGVTATDHRQHHPEATARDFPGTTDPALVQTFSPKGPKQKKPKTGGSGGGGGGGQPTPKKRNWEKACWEARDNNGVCSKPNCGFNHTAPVLAEARKRQAEAKAKAKATAQPKEKAKAKAQPKETPKGDRGGGRSGGGGRGGRRGGRTGGRTVTPSGGKGEGNELYPVGDSTPYFQPEGMQQVFKTGSAAAKNFVPLNSLDELDPDQFVVNKNPPVGYTAQSRLFVGGIGFACIFDYCA